MLLVITLDANSVIPLSSVGVVIASAFWLGKQLQHIKDKLLEGDKRFDRIEKCDESREATLKEVAMKLNRVEILVNGTQKSLIEAAQAAAHAAGMAAQRLEDKT